MTTFITTQIEIEGVKKASGNWSGKNGICVEAAKHHRSKVTVEEYTGKDEISEAQRKWVHCKSGPIRKLVAEGWSFREAKEHIKVEYGRQWFVIELTDDNFKKVDGVFRWECRKPLCRKLLHPLDVVIDEYGASVCPECYGEIHPIALKSIMDVSVKNTNKWFKEIFAHMKGKDKKGVSQPDPAWSEKEKSD